MTTGVTILADTVVDIIHRETTTIAQVVIIMIVAVMIGGGNHQEYSQEVILGIDIIENICHKGNAQEIMQITTNTLLNRMHGIDHKELKDFCRKDLNLETKRAILIAIITLHNNCVDQVLITIRGVIPKARERTTKTGTGFNLNLCSHPVLTLIS